MCDQVSRSGIIACGNFLVDHVKTIDAWPGEESLALILDAQKGNGGGPYNVLKDLSNLGADYPLEAYGLIGKDAYGDYIRKDLEGCSINTRLMTASSSVNTAHTDVMADSTTNKRTFFYHAGANSEFELDPDRLLNSTCRILYYGYIGLLPKMDQVDPNGIARFTAPLIQARNQGFITIADAVSIPNSQYGLLIRSAISCLDYLFINDHELQLASGEAIRNSKQAIDPGKLEQCARKLREENRSCTLIVHFPEGALAIDREDNTHWQGSLEISPERIRGTVGAGDAFCAGFIHGLYKAYSIADCLELAVCTAAACLTHPTASGGVVTEAQCRSLSTSHPQRKLY